MLYENIVENGPDAVIFADREGVIRVWNRRAQAILGFTAEEAIGQSLDLIVPERFRGAHWAGFRRAVARGRFASFGDAPRPSWARTKQGGTVLLELTAAILKEDAGEVLGVVAVAREAAASPS